MNRIVHFEILVNDTAQAIKFYTDVFGWKFEDYSQFVNYEYWGIVSGGEDTPGINGGLMKRQTSLSPEGSSPRAYVCTIQVENYDEIHEKILSAGGKVLRPKVALPRMAWQGYYTDPDGNEFGIHETDENAI